MVALITTPKSFKPATTELDEKVAVKRAHVNYREVCAKKPMVLKVSSLW